MKNQKKLISAMEAIRKQDPLLAEAIEKAWKSLNEGEFESDDFDVDDESYIPDTTRSVMCSDPKCNGIADVVVDQATGDEYAQCLECGKTEKMTDIEQRNEIKESNRPMDINRARNKNRNEGKRHKWTDDEMLNVFGEDPFGDDIESAAI